METKLDFQGRKIRGYAIISKGDMPEKLGRNVYCVSSQSMKGKKYIVFSHPHKWECECPDWQKNEIDCKHIYSIKFWLELREKLNEKEIIEMPQILEPKNSCSYCKSENIIKRGIRKNDSIKKQRYLCKDCGKRFVEKPFKKIKGNAQIITLVLDLYFKGISLRKIQDHLKQLYNFKVNHATIYRWIKRYMKAIGNYVDAMQPKVSGSWNVDEQMIKVKDKYAWCWNAIDTQTRFLIANNVTQERSLPEAQQIFHKANDVVKVRPDMIITDGLASYGRAISREFRARGQIPVKHIRLESIRAHVNNNKVERYHNTFRERDKVARSWKSNKTLQEISDAYRTYYNFVREHQGLNGLTPAQLAGLDLNLGQNRWLSLIKQASDGV